MGESITKPGTYQTNQPEDAPGQNINVEGTPSTDSQPAVIWTPRFMVIFTLALVFGLSIESLLTQGWLNRAYTGQWVFQAHVILICFCWLALLIVARSSWVRLGSIFGCIWALFMTANITIDALNLHPGSLAHVSAATCIALLGSYICLSIARTPFSRLDTWLFGLAPIAGILAVALIYFLTPAHARSLSTLESAIATVALVLSLLVWWIRPTSWKAQPGPTFLFGCVPALLLLLSIPGMGFNSSNYFLAHVVLHPISNLAPNEPGFFLSQVALLCLLLGTMRVLKGER